MNRYAATFEALRARHETAFIPFAVAGDPDLSLSEDIFKAYVDAGADVLEVGYPFSDPVADGPVNQRAANRAIAAGISPRRFFELMARIRRYTDIPIGILMYANTMHHVGTDTFCRRAADSGVDSILVADMPPEEADGTVDALHRHGLQSVFIVSELTPPQRLKAICRKVSGFVYVVSRLGTTGVQTDLSTSVGTTLHRLRPATKLPLCVGFGISKPEHVVSIRNAGADGAIVGSALVATVESLKDKPSAMLKRLSAMVRDFKRATR
ncbi:MAG: tryptophan synthase subunit alpha [Chitinivibrionales bacterium]|nr:tryptophan synthase subunit alpha [Chitinivibrionales bacterium]